MSGNHRRRAQAFRAFTVKAHFIVHSNFIVQSEAKRKKKGKKKQKKRKNEKRGKRKERERGRERERLTHTKEGRTMGGRTVRVHAAEVLTVDLF